MLYALKCMEHLITDELREIEPTAEAYQRWNAVLDERNAEMAWSDPRARNYYWSSGRSATMSPLHPTEIWRALAHPDFSELHAR
jgi:hypothetical protein